MPLNWDVANIENHKVVTTDPNDSTQWHPLTLLLVNLTMSLGINDITEKSAPEFYTRARALEKIEGCSRKQLVGKTQGGVRRAVDQPLTWAEVKSHIGLATNASKISVTRFWLNMRKRHEDNSERHIRFAEKELADEQESTSAEPQSA